MKNDNFQIIVLKKINKGVFFVLVFITVVLLIFSLTFSFGTFFNQIAKDEFEIEMMMRAYAASDIEDYDSEIMIYFTIMERLPELKYELYFLIGNAFLNKGDLYEATRHFYNALENGYADSASVFFNLAMVAQQTENFDMAIDFYTKVLKDDPYDYDANYNLGNIYFIAKKNNNLALEAYKRALKEFSVHSAYRDMLRSALKEYSARRNPEIHSIIKQQLNIKKGDKYFEKFDFAALKAPVTDQNQAIIHTFIGMIYASEDKDSLARFHYEKAEEINQKYFQESF